MEENKKENQPSDEQKKENFFSKFIKKHILVLILILIIIGVFLYSMIRVSTLESRHEKQTSELITEYNAKIDSVNLSGMKHTIEVFTWAIRSELIRQNTEEVKHFFTDFINKPHVVKIQLIDPESFEISLSTNEKDIGEVIDNTELYKVDKLTLIENTDHKKLISPIMRLNRVIGILVVYVDL